MDKEPTSDVAPEEFSFDPAQMMLGSPELERLEATATLDLNPNYQSSTPTLLTQEINLVFDSKNTCYTLESQTYKTLNNDLAVQDVNSLKTKELTAKSENLEPNASLYLNQPSFEQAKSNQSPIIYNKNKGKKEEILENKNQQTSLFDGIPPLLMASCDYEQPLGQLNIASADEEAEIPVNQVLTPQHITDLPPQYFKDKAMETETPIIESVDNSQAIQHVGWLLDEPEEQDKNYSLPFSFENQGKVLIVGGACVDVTLAVEHMPVTGGDAYARAKSTQIGGCAYNVAYALRCLGIQHDFIAPIGKGPNADLVKEQLTKDGYKLEIFDPSYDCEQCLCIVDRNGERTFIAIPGIEYHFKSQWLENIDLNQYDLIFITGFDIAEDNGSIYLNKYKQKPEHTKIFFDAGARVNFITAQTKQDLYDLHPILHLNRMELELMSGTTNIEKGLDILDKLTQSPIIVSLDEDGAYISEHHKRTQVPVIKQKVVDATGAGDAHSAGMIAGLMCGLDIIESCKLGHTIAAYTLNKIGSKIELPTSFSLEQAIKQITQD